MIIYFLGGLTVRNLCVRAPEYLGCYILPFKVKSGKQEIRFEGGLLKVFESGTSELERKQIYRPLA